MIISSISCKQRAEKDVKENILVFLFAKFFRNPLEQTAEKDGEQNIFEKSLFYKR